MGRSQRGHHAQGVHARLPQAFIPPKPYETRTDEKGNKYSIPMLVDGNTVECKKAIKRRDQLIEHLQSLPPMQSALDQLVKHFVLARVAEVTGARRGDGHSRRLAARAARSAPPWASSRSTALRLSARTSKPTSNAFLSTGCRRSSAASTRTKRIRPPANWGPR